MYGCFRGRGIGRGAKIVMAEYALDFAMLAADRALLMSMEAIEAQMKLEEKKN